MASRYDALVCYLAAQPGDRVTLTLAEIEAIVGTPLPARARQRRWWTGNQRGSMPRSRARDAGWRIVLDGFWGRTPVVTFVREGGGDAPAGRP